MKDGAPGTTFDASPLLASGPVLASSCASTERTFLAISRLDRVRDHPHNFERAGMPVISVDSKKKELIGRFKNAGRAWNRHAPEVFSHEFPSNAISKAIAYGVYDPVAHRGSVYVDLSYDTPDFAVAAIVRWRQVGRHRYPGARRLLILADSGGSKATGPDTGRLNFRRAYSRPTG